MVRWIRKKFQEIMAEETRPVPLFLIANSDIIAQFVPWKLFTSRSISEFSQIPFWNPHAFGGAPFFGDFLSSIFYPLNIPIYLNYSHSFFGYRLLLDVLLAGIFMYFFGKEIGLDKKSSIIGSMKHSLPQLPYAHDALEPHIDAEIRILNFEFQNSAWSII